MKPQRIPAETFDLVRFVETVIQFWGGDHQVAFPLVENGFADFGTDCLGDDAEVAGNHPLEWLQTGHNLFGQFTRRDDDHYDLADGSSLEIPDEDEAGTQLDECTTYGFLVSLKDNTITIQTALLTDVSGEPKVYPVDDAGIFEEKMGQFVESMQRNIS